MGWVLGFVLLFHSSASALDDAYRAALDNDVNMIRSRRWTPEEINYREGYFWNSALFVAAVSNHSEFVRELLLRRADVNILSDGDVTPLIGAASKGYVETARLLLDAGANVNLAMDNGVTPLMGASYNGHVEMVKLLLEYDADRTLRSFPAWGEETALDKAKKAGKTMDNRKVIELLEGP
jgi:ankyrin repeat protein